MFNVSMKLTALQQHPNFTNALQASGAKAFSCEITHSEFIQRGPFTYVARPHNSVAYAAMRHIGPSTICVLNPDSPAEMALKAAGFRQLMTPATVAEIDLTQPPRMLGKWRNALRKSERSAIKTKHRPFKLVNDHWLFDADKAQQRHKKFRAMSHIVPLNWPVKDTLFSVAIHKGEPIAAMLFLLHHKTATYQIGWSNPLGRAFCAHQRLLHEAQQHLVTKGILRLDLGTIDTENLPGLARFKIGAGAQPRQLGGTWAALPLWRR